MQTRITRLLDIRYPVIQAPVGSATTPELVSSVSNAGGLGMLALSRTDNDTTREKIRETKKMTSRPFGVNLVLEWDQSDRVQICMEEQVPLVSFFWGNSTAFIQPLKEKGIKICHTVGNSKEAVFYEQCGVDFIVAQGWEAGGHVWGTVASSVLISAIAEKISIPLVSAGGFADGKGLLAALSLGASGIWVGSKFLMAKEANVSKTYRELIAGADENDTLYVERLFNKGWDFAPHRVIRNSTVKAWEEAGRPEEGQRPNEHEILGYNQNGKPLERYSDEIPAGTATGNLEALAIYAGQSAALIKDEVTSAEEIIQKIITQAQERLDYLHKELKK